MPFWSILSSFFLATEPALSAPKVHKNKGDDLQKRSSPLEIPNWENEC
jgi:hypothetical protein